MTTPTESKDERIEDLAAYAHDAWSGWIDYLFAKCERGEDGMLIIPSDSVQRWSRQAATNYSDLPESEKESDRDEAKTILAITEANSH
jgi:hypothetical protein